MSIRLTIRDFVSQLLAEHGHTETINDDDSLILSGLLDSLAVVNILVFLEQQYNIDLSELYFDQASFDSIELIVEFVRENQPAANISNDHS
jgi:methoxymalonate biosynthesis acyl carrier protein